MSREKIRAGFRNKRIEVAGVAADGCWIPADGWRSQALGKVGVEYF